MDHRQTIETPLGLVHFFVDAEATRGGSCTIDLRMVEPQPWLPEGMSVRRLRAVMLTARSETGFERFHFVCRFETPIRGSPNPGECLDAQEWDGERDRVMIGTEDGEALRRRMPWLEMEGDPLEFILCEPDGFTIPIERVPAGATVGLHYVVAENDYPEVVDCSAWFAVEIPHRRLVTFTELPTYSWMESRIEALDALSTYVGHDLEGYSAIEEMRVRVGGSSRWFPVDGGYRILLPYKGGPYDDTLFSLEPGAWDHEHCELCGGRIESMVLCHVTKPGDPSVRLCSACFKRHVQSEGQPH